MMEQTYKKHLFDRSDGWRIRKNDPLMVMVPYIMRTRVESQNLYEEEVDLAPIEQFIHDYSAEIPGLSVMTVLIAAMVRLLSQRPYLNRFVVWNKLYARNSIEISLSIKRQLSDSGEETTVKMRFDPTDTIREICARVQKEIEASQPQGNVNGTDAAARWMGKMPSPLLRFVIWLAFRADSVGKMPKSVIAISPFHCSIFVTNLGSIGIKPVYHHLYEMGTCSAFVSMGKKLRRTCVDENGEQYIQKYLTLKVNTDERICDGYYYASSMRMIHKYLVKPEILLAPPETVIADDGVGRPVGT